MKMLNVEKWTDWVVFLLALAEVVRQAICANYMAMVGWLCAALWVTVAMIRRNERDSWRRMHNDIVKRWSASYECE